MNLILAIAATAHIGLSGDLTERHWHIRAQHDQFIAGAFLNSENNTSIYAGGRWMRENWFGEIGIVSGYEMAPVLPYFRAGYSWEHVDLFVGPAVIGAEWKIVQW